MRNYVTGIAGLLLVTAAAIPAASAAPMAPLDTTFERTGIRLAASADELYKKCNRLSRERSKGGSMRKKDREREVEACVRNGGRI